jgi:hypothetical protein
MERQASPRRVRGTASRGRRKKQFIWGKGGQNSILMTYFSPFALHRRGSLKIEDLEWLEALA